MSYLSGIYLESWFSWLDGWVQKTLKKKKKTDKRKTLKNEEKEKRRIQGKLLTTINIFGFTLKNIKKWRERNKEYKEN